MKEERQPQGQEQLRGMNKLKRRYKTTTLLEIGMIDIYEQWEITPGHRTKSVHIIVVHFIRSVVI